MEVSHEPRLDKGMSKSHWPSIQDTGVAYPKWACGEVAGDKLTEVVEWDVLCGVLRKRLRTLVSVLKTQNSH